MLFNLLYILIKTLDDVNNRYTTHKLLCYSYTNETQFSQPIEKKKYNMHWNLKNINQQINILILSFI